MRPTLKATLSMGRTDASRKSVTRQMYTLETLYQRLIRPLAAYPQTLFGIPAGYLHTPGTDQDIHGLPAYPRLSEYLQGTRIPLTLFGIPARYLHTPDTDQDMKEEQKRQLQLY